MLIIQILVLVFVFNAVKYALKQNKENQAQEQKAREEAKVREQKAREEAKVREQKAREQELIRKFLSSDRSKKLGLTEEDVTIIYVTETQLLNNGYSKKITYPKVVRVELS